MASTETPPGGPPKVDPPSSPQPSTSPGDGASAAGETSHAESGEQGEQGEQVQLTFSVPPRSPPVDVLGGGWGSSSFSSLPLPQAVLQPLTLEELHRVWLCYLLVGIGLAMVGVAAITFPLAFSIAVDIFLGWLLLFAGMSSLIHGLFICGDAGTGPFLLLGALHFAVGLWLVLNPLKGIVSITIILSGWFIGQGIAKMVMACQVRNNHAWFSIGFSGLMSVLLGTLIFSSYPDSGKWAIGVLLGADLLFTGSSLAAVACVAYANPSLAPVQQPLLV